MSGDMSFSEILGKGEVNYGRILMIHISRCANRSAFDLMNDEEAEACFKNTIRFLEMMLYPWIDDKYESKKEEIKQMSEPYNTLNTVDEFFMLVGELMKLARRADLLPAEEVGFSDEGTRLSE